MSWHIASDTFTFQAVDGKKSFTWQGLLSTVNSLYDPFGFIAPITINGMLLLKELSAQAEDWDSPLPDDMKPEWMRWRNSIQRTHSSFPTSELQSRDIFADASVKAVAAVAYLRYTSQKGQTDLGFVLERQSWHNSQIQDWNCVLQFSQLRQKKLACSSTAFISSLTVRLSWMYSQPNKTFLCICE